MRVQNPRLPLHLLAAIGALALILQACSCGDTAVTARGKPLGDLCELDIECESGFCDAIPGGQKVCMKPCSHGCDYENGELCTTLAVVDTVPRQACVPDKGGLCNECTMDADCPYPGDVCLQIDGKGVCGRDCSFEGAPCPDGYVCAAATNSSGLVVNRQCQPKTGSCDCLPATAGQTRSCTIANAMGTCGGMETCDPAQGFIGCDAKVPQAEKCNLEDDNCDGRIDEDSETAQNPAAGIQPKSCGKGACFRSVPGCIDGKEQSCEPGVPTNEICNGLDDDCNGTVDEPFPDLGAPCSNGVGICQQAGVMVCTGDGAATACGAVPLPPNAESCNKLDDDCNGSIDDMGTVSCGLGICENTIVKCQNGQEPACVPLNGNKRSETCNELDDDCDGIIDNGYDLSSDLSNCGKCGTTCRVSNGTPQCDTGQCHIKSCNTNQGYDDCDRLYSTGCEQDIWGSLDHCGACNQVCAFPNANARCTGGACSMGPCKPGWYDTNGSPADGCEYQCTFLSLNDEPDDGFADANCDGIDGDLASAIFVDCGAGNDQNPGTRSQPLKTLTRALQTAPSAGKRQILVANALCNEAVTLEDGIGLYGGYNGQTWARSFANLPIIQPSVGGVPAIKGDGILTATAVDGFVVASQAGISPSGSSIAIQLNNANGVRISNSDVRAAAGAAGVDGQPGTKGGDGGVGDDGDPGTDGGSGGGFGGTGGSSACAPGRSGGRGGYDSEDGAAGGEAVFCAGNRGGYYGNCSVGSSCDRRLRGETGGTGCGGASAGAGSNGSAGGAAGAIVGGNFVASNGGDGTNGGNGVAGAGGGGGGGSNNRNCVNFLGCNCVNTGCYSDRGGGGGGGGGAGCGGTRGTGGTGGGGSIGILLVNSDPVIRNTKITTANGGKGGDGKAGGAPGVGGGYGTGGASRDDGGAGGNGGRGGDGGRGGAGGGGGGGPSVGIYRASGSNPTITSVTYTLGQAGAGGAGGISTNAGAAGVRQNTWP